MKNKFYKKKIDEQKHVQNHIKKKMLKTKSWGKKCCKNNLRRAGADDRHLQPLRARDNQKKQKAKKEKKVFIQYTYTQYIFFVFRFLSVSIFRAGDLFCLNRTNLVCLSDTKTQPKKQRSKRNKKKKKGEYILYIYTIFFLFFLFSTFLTFFDEFWLLAASKMAGGREPQQILYRQSLLLLLRSKRSKRTMGSLLPALQFSPPPFDLATQPPDNTMAGQMYFSLLGLLLWTNGPSKAPFAQVFHMKTSGP